ncbi:hypothetical protein GCM10009716_34020 [Streptomyces sodiiphilus]|uniref:Uncharacterized protein n=1 Tax=Streptomyces sodiiphilus TaxID=226217 RepID=A0ABN2PJI9_9ACTN
MPDALRSAVTLLSSLGVAEPRLALGTAEAMELAPLVGQWRAAGASHELLRSALTAGLPERVHSAVGLHRKLPQRPAVPPEDAGRLSGPAPVRRGLSEYPDCRDPVTEPGRCRTCRDGGPPPAPDISAFVEAGKRGAARARAALRGLAPPPGDPCPA